MVTATAQILPSGTEQPRREKGLEWPLVLTDPEALFRPLNWQAAFDYVNQALRQTGKTHRGTLLVYFRDLYFCRRYLKRRDFGRFWEQVESLGLVGYRPGTLGRPEVGRQLVFGQRRAQFILSEAGGKTILAMPQAAPDELELVRTGKFPHQPLTWNLGARQLLKFLADTGGLLTGEGETLQARLNLDVLSGGCLLRARMVFPQCDAGEGSGAGNCVPDYQKLWFGDNIALRRMMSWQQIKVRGI